MSCFVNSQEVLGVKEEEEERKKEGGGGCSSETEEMAVNGLRDGDHISFSYSSDDDFLPRHMTTPTGPNNKKPYNDTNEKPHNGWQALDLTSDVEGERERRRSDSLSLDQKRRRLCSITPRGPLATPTLTTPPSSTGDLGELSRQPVSPPHPSPPRNKHSEHSPNAAHFRKSRSPGPHSRKSHSPIRHLKEADSPEVSGRVDNNDCSDSNSSSGTWQPTGGGVGRRKRREQKKGRRKRERKEKVVPGRQAKTDRQPVVGESSDEDEHILKQLKRKVQEATEQGTMTSNDITKHQQGKMTSHHLTKQVTKQPEKMTSQHVTKQRASHDVTESESEGEKGDSGEAKKGNSLEEELAMTSSESSDSGEEREERESCEDGEVGVGGKVRSKRQLLSSSDSESESPATRKPIKLSESRKQDAERRTQHLERSHVREKPPDAASRHGPKRSLPEATPTSSPAKKLRLVDIDFTGGRMKLPPSRPQPRPSPSKSRLHSERPGAATHRKLAPVPANASNILKSKPLPRPHPPIKKVAHDKGAPTASKDAVLAAKFPQKRKLLDTPSSTHKSSKFKHSSFRHL